MEIFVKYYKNVEIRASHFRKRNRFFTVTRPGRGLKEYSLFICHSVGPHGTSWPSLPDADAELVKSVAVFASAELTEEMAGCEQEAGASLGSVSPAVLLKKQDFRGSQGTDFFQNLPLESAG